VPAAASTPSAITTADGRTRTWLRRNLNLDM
jgi:hypothetical protein